MSAESLKHGHRRALEQDHDYELGPRKEKIVPQIEMTESHKKDYLARNERLKDVPPEVVRAAWFTLSHLLLDPGSTLANMGLRYRRGTLSYAMAALNPKIHIIGVDPDKKIIQRAAETYKLPNLEFRVGDISDTAGFEENSLDAIVNSFTLHKIFTGNQHTEEAVKRALEKQMSLLKQGGIMFIRDHVAPPPEEIVLLEMQEETKTGKNPEKMSEADLLLWFSVNARPWDRDECRGFFLEELPPRYPKTKLFRLPHKWASEFIIRKDDRKNLQRELSTEYTFFTERDFRQTLRKLGSRVLYTAPHWDSAKVMAHYENSFNMYKDSGTILGVPPTSFITVARKMGDDKSLRLRELRAAQEGEERLVISAMRNDATGRITDIVSRNMNLTEVLPYRVTEDGELNVYVYEGLPRCIVNTVPRSGQDLDGKRWSGHMTEAVAIATETIDEVELGGKKEATKFCRDYFDLKPAMGCSLEKGKGYFPAPDYIDECIQTRYIRVQQKDGQLQPKISVAADAQGASGTEFIREVSAQDLLSAINVGFIPNARLELQILALYEMLNMEAETWTECPLTLQESIPDNILDMFSLIRRISEHDNRFKETKGTTGQIRTVQSVFVDEGSANGTISGLSAENMEFVISHEDTVNTAVVLPLTRHAETNNVMVGVTTEYLPAPQRHKGNGLTVRAPSFPLPKNITTFEQARQFVAEKFETTPDNVRKLGESYFCHIGITPQRIFPFAVASSACPETPAGGATSYADIRHMRRIIDMVADWNVDLHIMWCMKTVQRSLTGQSDMDLKYHEGRQKTGPSAASTADHTIQSSTVSGVENATTPPPSPPADIGVKPLNPDSREEFSAHEELFDHEETIKEDSETPRHEPK